MDRDKLIAESANILVPFIKELDPLWADYIEVMRAERGFDNLQIMAALVGYTLDQAGHMWVPQHPFFFDTHKPAGSKSPCKQCGLDFIAPYPGAQLCGNDCAYTYYGTHETGTPAPPVTNVPEARQQEFIANAEALLPTEEQIEAVEQEATEPKAVSQGPTEAHGKAWRKNR